MSWVITETFEHPYGPWYDFDSAIYDANGVLQLNSYGCYQGDDIWNCTRACLDTNIGPAQVFNYSYGMYTLSNCLVLPVIASLLAAGNISQSSLNITEKYNIKPRVMEQDPDKSWPVIRGCLTQFCAVNGESTPGCSSKGNDRYVPAFVYAPTEDLYTAHYDDNTGEYHYPDNFTFAGTSEASAFHVYETWAVWPILVTLLPFHGKRKSSQLARQTQAKIRASNHAAALVAAISEFQKAQVFFMLAVQIAALLALHNPNYIEATSWQQLWNNIGILFNLAFGGCLPVLFAFFLQRLAGVISLYNLIATFCCVVLSATTWFLTYNSNPNPETSIKYEGPPLDQCAGVAPTKYCYSADWFFTNSNSTIKGVPELVFCFVVLICLTLDQVRVFKPQPKAGGEVEKDEEGRPIKANCFEWMRQKILQHGFWRGYNTRMATRNRWFRILHLDTSDRLIHTLERTFLLLTEFAFVALNIVLISDYAHLLLPNDFQSLDLKAWGLGQVIAVTIWVPVFLEYLYIAAGGPEEAFKGRLHKDFEVVRKHHDTEAKLAQSKLDEDSSAVDLAQIQPMARPGYERVNSDAMW